jgi:hypothetical protein
MLICNNESLKMKLRAEKSLMNAKDGQIKSIVKKVLRPKKHLICKTLFI